MKFQSVQFPRFIVKNPTCAFFPPSNLQTLCDEHNAAVCGAIVCNVFFFFFDYRFSHSTEYRLALPAHHRLPIVCVCVPYAKERGGVVSMVRRTQYVNFHLTWNRCQQTIPVIYLNARTAEHIPNTARLSLSTVTAIDSQRKSAFHEREVSWWIIKTQRRIWAKKLQSI